MNSHCIEQVGFVHCSAQVIGTQNESPEMLRKHAGFRAGGREDAQICRRKLQAYGVFSVMTTCEWNEFIGC